MFSCSEHTHIHAHIYIYIYIYTRCVWKVTRLVSQRYYFNSKQQTRWFHLQINPILPCYTTSMQCWKDSFGMAFSFILTTLLIAFSPSKWISLMIPFELGEKKTSYGARSDESGGCSGSVMFLSAWNCWIFRMLWTSALLWWSSHDLSCQNLCLFSHTEWSIYHRIFSLNCWLIAYLVKTRRGWCLYIEEGDQHNFDGLDLVTLRFSNRRLHHYSSQQTLVTLRHYADICTITILTSLWL